MKKKDHLILSIIAVSFLWTGSSFFSVAYRLIEYYSAQVVDIYLTIIGYLPVSYTHLDVYKRQVQTFGDFLNFNPHLHIIATDGCFNENNDFMVGLSPKAEDLIPAFKQAIFKLLLKEGKISNALIENMNSWVHDGFHAVSYTHLDVYKRQQHCPLDDQLLQHRSITTPVKFGVRTIAQRS